MQQVSDRRTISKPLGLAVSPLLFTTLITIRFEKVCISLYKMPVVVLVRAWHREGAPAHTYIDIL